MTQVMLSVPPLSMESYFWRPTPSTRRASGDASARCPRGEAHAIDATLMRLLPRVTRRLPMAWMLIQYDTPVTHWLIWTSRL